MSETTTPKPFNFYDLLADPNTQMLLAGIGTAMDEEGAGGVIGKPTMNLVRSKAAQSAAAQQLASGKAEREELRLQHRQLLDKLGPITGPSETGLNSVKPAANNTANIDFTTQDAGKLVSTLGGFSPLEQEGVNSVRRSPNGSLLVNYTLPKIASQPTVASEVDALAAAPTASRDTSRLSYQPTSQAAVQTEVDDLLDPYTGRRRTV